MRATRKRGWLKTLDRYAGIPIVAALAPLRLGRRRPDEIRRIGVMKTAAIGDLVLASGPIADFRRAYPSVELVLITGADNAAVVPLLPFAVERHVIVSPTRPLEAVRQIRTLQLDVIVDLGSWPRFDALLAGLSGAAWRIGFRRRGQGRSLAFDETVDHSPARHEIDNYRALMRLLGVDGSGFPRLTTSSAAPEIAPVKPYVVFHPWSGGDRGWVKEWPRERWTELATRLGDGLAYVVTAGPGDVARSQSLVLELRGAGLDADVAALALDATARLLAGSVGVVSVNTGIMHLAAAVGARTLSLEGPVPIARWGPIGEAVASVESTTPGSGYLDLGFEYVGQRTDCMTGVSVDAAAAAFRALTGGSAPIG